jgi:hypothetical protein
VVTFASGEGSAATLRGFTVRDGGGYQEVSSTSTSCGSGETCVDYVYTYCGGGIYVDGADPTLTDLIITDNDLTLSADYSSGNDDYFFMSYGGGLCLRDSAAAISDVEVWTNYADEGGGFFLNDTSSVTLSRSYVVGNTAENGGAAQIDGGAFYLTNVAMGWNSATTEGGGLLGIDGTLVVINATLDHNEAPSGANLYASGSTGLTLLNSIISNAVTGEGVLVDGSATFTGTYNNVYGNAGGDYSGTTDPTGTVGNISDDPLFTDVTDDGDLTNDDWTLGAGSPSIDAGDPSASYTDTDGTTNDQGAWGGPDGDW